jgi:purine-binding chemotaxis protein CheW
MAHEHTDAPLLQLLTCELRGQRFALPLQRIREVVEHRAVTRVPSAPDFVQGVINLRGMVIPVVDMGKHIGLPAYAPSRRTCLLIVEIPSRGEPITLGLIVDSVADVLEVPRSGLRPPPPFGVTVRLDFISGLAPLDGGEIVTVLDSERMLSREELEAAAGARGVAGGSA